MRIHQSAGERKFIATRAFTTAATSALVVKFAFSPYPQVGPGSTWHPGEWIESTRTARVLVGAGALVLQTGNHRVWISATNGTENVIALLGTIRVI